MKNKMFCLFILSTIFFSGCGSTDDEELDLIGQKVVFSKTDCSPILIDREAYLETTSELINIENIEVNDSCLKIMFWASGCSGETWEMGLIDSEGIKESNPPQRDLRLWLKNDEPCEGELLGEISFELSNLKIEEANSIILNLNGVISTPYNY